MNTRRDLLKTIAVIPAAAAAAPAQKAFTASQFQMLTRIVSLIIPRSDSPGAADAGVHHIIDAAAAADPALHRQIEQALRQLDGVARTQHNAAFLDLGEEEQIRVLEAGGRALSLLKDLTCDGYYSTREGLVQELGYKGNTFLHEFEGCTHPEHQA